MNNYIKSPINYTGNKYRLLSQLEKFLPKKCDIFVDMFCGGATVGFNVEAKKVILIDSNKRVISLLKTLAKSDFNKIINEIEEIINNYNLSYSYKIGYKYYRDNKYVEGNNGLKKYNKNGFEQLKKDYNIIKNKNTFKSNIMLYVLMVYGFNNDLRFNSQGDYNLPVGKTDFNKNNFEKLLEFNNKAKEINYEFICADFKSNKVKNILLSADFVYCDPPYLITNAVYNENKGWTEKDENDLLNLLSNLNGNNIKFALSNVLKKEGKCNSQLDKWINDNNFKKNKINYHYRSSSYNKKNRNSNEEEILVINEV